MKASILLLSFYAALSLGCGDDSHVHEPVTPIDENNNNEIPPALNQPTLTLVSPSTGTPTTSENTTIVVKWTGELDSLEYTNGDTNEPISGPFEGGEHEFDVALAEGINTISVSGKFIKTETFEAGSRTVEVVVVRPTEDIFLTIDALIPNALPETIIRGTILAEQEPTLVATLDEEFEGAVEPKGENEYTFEVLVPLQTGLNEIQLTASAGEHSTTRTVEIERLADDQAPTIESHFPSSGHDVRSTRPFLRAKVSDNVGIAGIGAVDPSGNHVSFTELDQEGWYGGYVDLAPGTNEVTLVAVDGSGNYTMLPIVLHQGFRTSSGGAHGGVVVDGELFLWGRNNIGQIGLGYTSTLSNQDAGVHPITPVPSSIEPEIVSISFTQNVSVALDQDGRVWAWGDNGDGQLGLGTPDPDDAFDDVDRHEPTQLADFGRIISISRGFDHTLALDENGHVWAWGDNVDGQLGDGTTNDSDVPIQVPNLSDVILILGSSASSYAVKSDGTLWAWGENTYGNLGNGVADTDAHPTPVQVQGISGVIDISAGRDHVLALTESGELYSWGLNASNQASPGEDHELVPLLRSDISDVQAVYAGGNQSFIERHGGRIYGWGQNINGNLGLIEDAGSKVPLPTSPVFGIENAVSVGIGALQGLVLLENGQVFSWGWSFEGSLGGAGLIDPWAYRVPVLVVFPE